MAVQITGRQIANAAVGVAKLSLSTGTFDFSSGDAVVSVNTPSADSHAATKGYVDGIAQGLNWKESVRAATTANITLSAAQTIDGVSIVADDRVLVKDQTDETENGIYICKSGSWVRADDMDAADEFSGAAIFIQEGTANADTGYVCTNNGDVTVGTDNINFTQFTGAGQLSAGNGIDITNSTISIDLDGSTLASGANGLSIAANGVGTSEIADTSVTNDKLAGSIAASKLAGSIPADKLNLGNGLNDNAGNLEIDLDGATLALGVNGLSIATGGVDSAELATDSVVSAKIADGAIDDSAYLADNVVTNDKLAGSIAASKLAGSIPADKLNLGNGLNDNAGNLEIDLDGATLALGVNGLSIATGGVDTNELAADCITNAKIADDAVQTENLNFAAFFSAFDADGSTLAFSLQSGVDLAFAEMFVVTVNGLVMEYKDTPDAQDNYKIDNGGVGDVARIVFGANLANGDRVTIRGFVNN